MSPVWQVRLLGEFSLICDDKSTTEVITGRSQALLAYLMLHRCTPQPRQRLAFHLWTESTDTQARTNLRKELLHLRRALPHLEQLLLIDAKTLQWQPKIAFTLDVAQFEEAIQVAQDPGLMQRTARGTVKRALEQAVELYRGDLLPDCDDEWIIPQRERLQQMHIRALEQLINLLKEQQDYRSALDYAQRLLRIAPLNEATYCTLMQLHGLLGDRANALQVYHRCMTLLREELGVDPSSTTRKLYEQLLLEDEASLDKAPASHSSRPCSSLPVPPSRVSLPPLVGRAREWNLIQQWVSSLAKPLSQRDTYDTTSTVLLLSGEPGIGKTRLLEELRETMQPGQVLWGRGFAAEMVRPYGIWIDALRSVELPTSITLATELGFLLPERGQPLKAPPDRSHLFDAVVQLLAEWASQAPLVIILDDVQWIDEASSALLHYAIRLLSHLPVQFACTARSGELEENAAISRVVQALRREQRLTLLELRPFDRDKTVELIRSVNSIGELNNGSNNVRNYVLDLSSEAIDQVFIDSGGNPLYALEVARAMSVQASSHNSSVSHADNLEALIGDRLQQLDNAAREFLSWAAALGRSFKPTRVAQVADYPLSQLLMAIEQLERQNIIRPGTAIGNEVGYDFSHDIVRQAVYRQLSEPRRLLVHLQIAHKLNQISTLDHALAGDIAHHASLGGDHQLAVSAALSAAERCLKLFAYAEAATLAQRGIQHCQQLDDSSRVRLQIRLLRCYTLAGVPKDQVRQLEATLHQLIAEAIALDLKDEEVIGLEALITVSYDYDNLTSVYQHSLRAAERVRSASPAVMARMLAHSGWCLAEIERDMDRAEALLLEAQSLAARVGLEIGDIACGLGCVRRHAADFAGAHLMLEQAWRMAQAGQDRWRECACLKYLAMVELEAGRFLEAIAYSTELEMVATKISGEASEGAMAAALTALANYRLQQPGADVALKQAIATLHQIDARRMLAYVLIGAAEMDLECQRFKLAVNRAEAALQAAQSIKHPSVAALAWAISIRGFLALGEQDQVIKQLKSHQGYISRPLRREWEHKNLTVRTPFACGKVLDLFSTEVDRHVLSVRARTAIDQVTLQMQTIAG